MTWLAEEKTRTNIKTKIGLNTLKAHLSSLENCRGTEHTNIPKDRVREVLQW